MRLLRVQVPEFRALKDVDISFEPDFTPQVFPLGSLNGGGKSTLLQLIFILLSLEKPTTNSYLENITAKLKINNYGSIYDLATITILLQHEVCVELHHKKICLKYLYGSVKTIDQYRNKKLNDTIYFYHESFGSNISILGELTLVDNDIKFDDNFKLIDIIDDNRLCRLGEQIIKKLFLISPSNQPYIFLQKDERRALFTKDNKTQYDQAVKKAQANLPNFFTFDFVDVLVEVFRRARAKDFKERNKNNPFAYTEKLESDINSLFIDGKKISSLIIEQQRHTEDEIQGIFFTLPSGQKIYPEDLSHGELKRLAIFVLIKYHEMQDAIVLIDEIENGFHLDWQYTIVRNLVEWGKNNQYILATHSYELCTAVTPAHVKEIEPKLTTK